MIKVLRAPYLEIASAHSTKMATIHDVIYFTMVLRQYTGSTYRNEFSPVTALSSARSVYRNIPNDTPLEI